MKILECIFFFIKPVPEGYFLRASPKDKLTCTFENLYYKCVLAQEVKRNWMTNHFDWYLFIIFLR